MSSVCHHHAIESCHTHMWDMTRFHVLHDCGMTHLHVIWLISMCDMTHLYVWHDSFTCVTWLTDMCDPTHLHEYHVHHRPYRLDYLLLRHMQASVNRDMWSTSSTHMDSDTLSVSPLFLLGLTRENPHVQHTWIRTPYPSAPFFSYASHENLTCVEHMDFLVWHVLSM